MRESPVAAREKERGKEESMGSASSGKIFTTALGGGRGPRT